MLDIDATIYSAKKRQLSNDQHHQQQQLLEMIENGICVEENINVKYLFGSEIFFDVSKTKKTKIRENDS